MDSVINSLRVRILLVVLVVLIPGFLLVWVTADEQRALAIEDAERNARTLTEVIAADNQQNIDSTHHLLLALAQLPSVRSEDADACGELFADLLQQYVIYNSIFLTDAQTGYTVCSALPLDEPVNNRDNSWFQQVIATRQFIVSEYRIGRVSGRPSVTMAQPVFDESGDVIAILGASLSLGWLNVSIQNTDLPEGSTVILVDREGTVLARVPTSEGIVGQPYVNQAVLDAIAENPQGTARLMDQEETRRLYGFTTLVPEEGALSVIVSFPEQSILTDAEWIRNRNLLTLAGLALLMVAASWIGSGFLIRPIQELTDTSRRIAAGQLHSRAQLQSSIVELQDMLDAFDDMAAVVERDQSQHLAEMAATNAQLRHEIEERTQAQARGVLLQELSASLSQALTTEQVARVIIERGLRPLSNHISALALFDEARDALRVLSATALEPVAAAEYETLPLDRKLPMVDAFVNAAPVWIESEAQYAESYPDLFAAFAGQPARAQTMVCLPLQVGSKTIGSLGVSFAERQPLDGGFRVMMITIAGYCAQALERARLYEKEFAERRAAEAVTERMGRLQAITAALADTMTVQDVARIIVEQSVATLDASTGAFHLVVEDGAAMEVVYSMGGMLPQDEIDAWRHYPLEPGYPMTDVVNEKKSLWFGSSAEHDACYPGLTKFSTLSPGGAVMLPIVIGGDAVGALSLGFSKPQQFGDDEHAFTVALTHQCALALERVRLAQQLQETAALEERQRLARDLHDAVSQVLFSSTTIAESLPRQWDRNPEKVREHLSQVVVLNRAAMAEMRTLLFELRPEAIRNTDLRVLLNHLIDAAKGRKHIQARLHVEGGDSVVPEDVHVTLYRIAQESINNVLKHSQASTFDVTLEQQSRGVTLTVRDNGAGFDTGAPAQGIGLISMRERAESVGAALEIVSQPGEGTSIQVAWVRVRPSSKNDGA